MDLDAAIKDLVTGVPGALGAIVCDFEGESVVLARGSAPLPPDAELHARSYIPSTMTVDVDAGEFLLKLLGAEPCALLRLFEEHSRSFGIGGVDGFEMRFREVDVIVRRLPEDYYVVFALRRPAVEARARAKLEVAKRALARMVA